MKKLFIAKQSHVWPGITDIDYLNNEYSWILRLLFDDYCFVQSECESDICISECSNIHINKQKMNIIFCGESDYRYHYSDIMSNHINDSNVKFIGTVEDSPISINVPMLVNFKSTTGFDLKIFDNVPSINERLALTRKRACFMRHNADQFRENMSSMFNVELVNGHDKIKIISQYAFNFCAENSRSLFGGNGGYITEKIYDCVSAQCIPIYYGGNIKKYSVLNPDRMIYIENAHDDKSHIIKNMSDNDVKEIFMMPIYRKDVRDFVKYREEKIKKIIK